MLIDSRGLTLYLPQQGPLMIEALKEDQVINQMGGRFKFTALAQARVRELMDGARPLVERKGRTDFEVAVDEIVQGKLSLKLPEEGENTTPAAEEPASDEA
jgi:DNA-directed RNA polymerase subunit omega